MSAEVRPSGVEDFGEVLSSSVDGRLPLLVGGQAVNLWALVYKAELGIEKQHPDLLPMTSKDLDLHGNLSLLETLGRNFGGSPVLGGERTAVVGRLNVTLRGEPRAIEVLRDVRGMSPGDLEGGWTEVTFGDFRARVPFPAILLKAKVANAAHIDQSDRNDVKHVKVMILVVRAHLTDLLEKIESCEGNARTGVKVLEDVLSIVCSSDALRCRKIHGIDFTDIWPFSVLDSCKSQPIANFNSIRLSKLGMR